MHLTFAILEEHLGASAPAMFWRRGRKKDDATAPDDGDDLAKLQRQFGIKTVSDKDVEADFRKLMGGATTSGFGLGLSPRTEMALFGGGAGDSDGEEAKILKTLNISGSLDSIDVGELSGEDEDEDEEGAKVAKYELRGVLAEVERTAKSSRGDEAATRQQEHVKQVAAPSLPEKIHAMKLQAVALKRKGKTHEALAVFREVKTLEAQIGSGAATAVQVRSSVEAVSRGRSVSYDDDKDVEVTDEDMENPEYLAQLAALGLPVDRKRALPHAETVESVEQQIRETKQRAVQLKRIDRIPDALAEMRRIKELEAKLAQMKEQTAAPELVVPKLGVRPVSGMPPVVGIPQVVVSEAHAMAAVDGDDDVDVTEDDMNDPAFAAELRKLGFDPSDSNEQEEAEQVEASPDARPSRPVGLAQRVSSVGDDDLIDEFEDDDESDGQPSPQPIHHDTVDLAPVTVDVQGPPLALAPPLGPPSDPEPASEATGASVEDLHVQLQKAKQSAVQLKRQGNIDAALGMMRRVKQIENLIEMKQKQAPAPSVAPSPEEVERNRKFNELDSLLVRFANDATREAKVQLAVDRAKAADWLAKRKAYSAQLGTLREKREIPGQASPPFHVKQQSEEVEVEHKEVPLDEVHLRILSVNDLKQAAGKDVFVKFNLSFPSSAPHEGKTGVVRIGQTPPYTSGGIASENAFRVKVQRSRGTQRLFEIKKAMFEVWRPGTLLRNPELIARGYQELAPLLSTSELRCHVPFVGSNRKPVGGDVEIAIRMRVPLRDKQVRTVVTEVLHVGPYPPPVSLPPPPPPPSTRPSSHSEPQLPHSPATSRPATSRPHSQSDVSARPFVEPVSPTVQPHRTPSAPAMQEPPADVDDPHDLDMIVSYDVINDEIERIEQALPNLQGEMAAEYSDRLDSLGLKKQILEIEMQTGKLTLDMYVARLKQRIHDDRNIIVRLMKAGRKPDAARVLHRVKIMEKELAGADDAGDAQDADSESA